MTGARAAGRAALTSTALPIKKQEAWRFTNLESLWKTGAAATGLEETLGAVQAAHAAGR